MYTNARSIVNKIQELKLYVEDANPDIIAITESWTHCNIPNSYLNLPNYYVAARHDRKDTLNGRGGGILIYVKDCLKSYETTDHCGFNQYASIEIILSKSNSLGLYVVYRSPNSTRNNNDQLIDVLRTVKNPAIVVGDFNYPLADWNTLQGCIDSQMLIDLVLDQFWTQSVTFPTHKSGNVLDLVFAETGIVNGVHDDGQLGSSDHSVLMIETNQLFSVNSGRNARLNYGKADFDKLRKMFRECDWRQVLSGDDVNVCWTRFTDVYNTVIGQCIPFYHAKRKNNPPWMSRDLLTLVRQKRKLWKKCKSNPCVQNWNDFKTISSNLKKRIQKAKLNLEKMIAKNSKQNPKAFYAYIGGKRFNRTGVGPLQDARGNIVTDDGTQAQMFNDYYGSVFEMERMPPPSLPLNDGPVLQTLEIYDCTVKDEIKKLKRHCSPGPDGIANAVLLEACDELVRPLTILFRMSLQHANIIQGRTLMKKVCEDCIFCKKLKLKYLKQLMGPLSDAQLSISPIFYYCYIDAWGPVKSYVPGYERETRSGHKIHEMMMLIFGCAATGMINCQMMEGGKNTDCVLDAFNRFFSEACVPKVCLPDKDGAVMKALTEGEIDIIGRDGVLARQKGINFETCLAQDHSAHGRITARIKMVQQSLER